MADKFAAFDRQARQFPVLVQVVSLSTGFMGYGTIGGQRLQGNICDSPVRAVQSLFRVFAVEGNPDYELAIDMGLSGDDVRDVLGVIERAPMMGNVPSEIARKAAEQIPVAVLEARLAELKAIESGSGAYSDERASEIAADGGHRDE